MSENLLIYNSEDRLRGSPLSLMEIEGFRNIQDCRLSPHPKFNFFYGNNAQGKTSFLEAIYFISELRSFRSQDLFPLIKHQRENSYLRAELSIHGIIYDVKASISAQGKEIFLNGKKPRPYSKLRQILPIVLFTPDSIRLFRSTPGDRRTYFDRFFSLLDEGYEESLDNFQKVLKQKQVLLDQYSESGFLAEEMLDVWNEKLAKWGAKLSFLRFDWTDKLGEKLNSYVKDLSKEEWESSLTYEPYCQKVEKRLSVEEIEKVFLLEIQSRQKEELIRCQVLVGPHRDDWVLRLGNQKLKEEGSQGQHRVCVAALKLSEVAILESLGKTPIALFDDLLSELDQARSRQMLETLSECHCQVFLTSVTPLGISLKGLEGLSYEIKEGALLGT